jgi:hypothetical protein
MTLRCEYHSNVADARQADGTDADRFDGARADPFDRMGWFAALHAACLADHAPLVATAQDGANAARLVLMRRDGATLTALANWYSFSWRPLLDGDGAAPLTALLRDLRRHAAMLELGPVPVEDGSADTLVAALRAAGWRVATEEGSTNHWLDTAGRRFDEWWAARPGALRSTVARKAKKSLVAIEMTSDFSDALWDEYEHVYRGSWKPAEASPDFLRQWAAAESAAGRLRLGIARIDGQPVAAQFWTCDHGVALIHKLAHLSGHDALSPGTLLTHAMFRHAFDVDCVRRIDFGTGDDGYKRDWMEASAPLLRIRAWDLRQPAAWPAFAKASLSRVAARARGR